MRELLRKRHEKYYKKNPWHLIADIGFIVLIIALIFTWGYLRHWQPQTAVSLEIKALGETESNQTQSFEIDYHANADLNNNTLTLYLPDDFKLLTVNPDLNFDTKTNTFNLADLKKGGAGKVTISGVARGKIGTTKMLVADFNCDACQYGVPYQYSYQIKNYSTSLNLTLPPMIAENSNFKTTLIIKNNGLAALDNAKLIINDWELIDFNPEIGGLAPGTEKQILLNIKAPANGQKQLTITLESQLNDGMEKQGEFNTIVNTGNSPLIITVGNSSGCIAGNEVINYAFHLENQGVADINNLTINFNSANSDFKLTNINFLNLPNNISSNNSNLTFLSKLSSGEKIDLSFSANFTRTIINADAKIGLKLMADYNYAETNLNQIILSKQNQIISNLKVSSNANYYSPQGDQLGVGPLPPVVDIPTNYWIFWEINNIGNPLNNFQITGDLGDRVYLTGNKTIISGNFYNPPQSLRAAWELGGINNSQRTKIGFEIGLMPINSDIGKVLPLLNHLSYSAIDNVCNITLKDTLKNLDTNLSTDLLANNKGTVIAE